MKSDLATPNGWELYNLKQLGEVNRGKSKHRPRDAEHLYDGKYPFIQTGDIRASEGRISFHKQTYSEAGLAQSRLWPTQTMCITIAANIAETGILSYPACFPDSVIGFIADIEKCNVYFIEYMFRLLKRNIQKRASGSVQDNINLKTLEKLYFPIPLLPTQKKIAHVLSTLDDKIELNRKMNKTLEEMAQALFKSWFVDFDPVHVKVNAAGREDALGYKKANATSEADLEQIAEELGISKEVLDLFPDEFEDSELGMIPKGWILEKLGSTKIIIEDGDRGKNYPSGKELMNKGFSPFLNNKNVIGDFISFDQANFISEDKFNILGKGKVSLNNLILTTRGSIGNVGIFHKYLKYKRARINSGMVVIKHNDDFNLTFLYYLFKNPAMKKQYITSSSGSVQKQLPIKDLKNLILTRPSDNVQDEFSKCVAPVLERIQQNQQQVEFLQKTRDTLLPKLLSGELDVSELELETQ